MELHLALRICLHGVLFFGLKGFKKTSGLAEGSQLIVNSSMVSSEDAHQLLIISYIIASGCGLVTQ
jgi:hypothetical protein